jgi:hypothetical protein
MDHPQFRRTLTPLNLNIKQAIADADIPNDTIADVLNDALNFRSRTELDLRNANAIHCFADRQSRRIGLLELQWRPWRSVQAKANSLCARIRARPNVLDALAYALGWASWANATVRDLSATRLVAA